MEREIRFVIVVEAPPAGVDYALQEGRGNDFGLVQRQRSTGKNLTFSFGARLKADSLLGPFVQGPKDGRFVYINIGTSAGQVGSPWTRRMKVPLYGTNFALGDAFETRVPGTAKDGTPTCATVKPFAGWRATAG